MASAEALILLGPTKVTDAAPEAQANEQKSKQREWRKDERSE